MENKYYTPTIEEFHVGFEYEVEDLHDDLYKMIWRPQIYKGEEMRTYLTHELEKKEIRVKYLDKEDIESLGWIPHAIMENNWFIESKLGTIYLYYQEVSIKDNRHITIDNDRNSNYLFIGYINNKSELKKLMKQLEIYEF